MCQLTLESELQSLEKRMRKELQYDVQVKMNKQVKAKRQELALLKQKIFAFPIIQVFFGLGKQYYFHISSSVTTFPLPFLISSSPLRKISTISGDDIIYSVSSMVLCLAVILLRARK